MARTIRWGILGTGGIARQFARGLAAVRGAELIGVGSRAAATARGFAREFGVPHAHAGYAALAADPEIDVIYVATPHPMHKDHTLLCLNGGKAVLCEKPFAMNAREGREMVACARRRRLFLMEAMWTHFFPAAAKVREIVRRGVIGEVRLVRAEFCFRGGWRPKKRWLNPDLGGGALLDVGVYTVAFAHMVYGREPVRVSGLPSIGKTGVDEQSAMVLGYDNGALAVLTCAVRTGAPQEALVCGTDGWIRLPCFWQPDRLILSRGGKQKEMAFKRLGNGYSFEARAVSDGLRKGLLESDVMPLDKTLGILRTMDRLREQWGLKYPME